MAFITIERSFGMVPMNYYEFSSLVQNVLVEHVAMVFAMMPDLYRSYVDSEPLSLDNTWGAEDDVRTFRALFGAEDLPPQSSELYKPPKRALTSRMTADDYRSRLDEDRQSLFDELHALRLEISRKKGCAPYIIFSNKSLFQMCLHLPESHQELMDLYGVGPKNAAEYGDAFLEVIRAFAEKYLAQG